MLQPMRPQQRSAAAFQTGRFGFHELAQRLDHPRRPGLEAAQKFLSGYGAPASVDMLTNAAKSRQPWLPEFRAEIAETRIAGSGLRI